MEEKELKQNNAKQKVLFGALLLTILIVLGSITYAFFTTTPDSTPINASLTAGTASMRFADNDDGISATLDFGESITKKFIIENTGTLPVAAKLNWKDLINTYMFKSLSYTLTYGDTYSETGEGYKKAKTSNDNVPPSAEPSTQELANGLVIPAGKTYYYNLTIKLESLDDVDQTADVKAKFSSKFSIEEGTAGLLIDKMMLAAKSNAPELNKVAPYPITYKDGVEDASNSLMNIVDTINNIDRKEYYYTYAESYTYDSESGTYSLVNPQVVKYKDGLETLKGKYIVSNAGSTANRVATYTGLGYVYLVKDDSDLVTLRYKVITKTPLSYDYSNDGVYKAEDDYGTSYIYRGAITNNYVKFGKNESGQDMYWRIIRLNGDGTLRMIYDGTQAWTNGVRSNNRVAFTSQFNTTRDDNKYVGYMYGGSAGIASTSLTGAGGAQTNETSSTIKTRLDDWYEKTFKDTEYEKYLADEIFCNDRSFAGTNTGTGLGQSQTRYGAYDRLITNKEPSLKCAQKNDAFTVSDTAKGNGALTYPIGLITADEAALAGGKYYYADGMSMNNGYYLYKGESYWSLSPSSFESKAIILGIYSLGYIITFWTDTSYVAPVINIKAEYLEQLEGNGTQSDPYYLSA